MMVELTEIKSESVCDRIDALIAQSDECRDLLSLFHQFTGGKDSVRYFEGDGVGQHRIHRGRNSGYEYELVCRLDFKNSDVVPSAELTITKP